MSNRKVIGPEYKDEYKRKHRSKFLSEDMDTKEKFGVFKVPDLFKPEHKKAFQDLYNYNDDVIKENKLPDEIEEEVEEVKQPSGKITEGKFDEEEEGEAEAEEAEGIINEDNQEEGENKMDQQIKQTFIDIFNPKLQLEAMKELEVEFYIKKGSKTDKELKRIKSGDDAVQFFAVQGNSTPCKFFFAEKVHHDEEWLFTPYDLVVIPKDKKKMDYFIITSSGINHVYEVHHTSNKLKNINQQAEYFTLRSWMYESTQFNILRHIKYFNQYLPFKLFGMWRNYTAFKKFQATREKLSKSLFMTKPAFVDKAIETNGKVNKLIDVKIQGIIRDSGAWVTPGLSDFWGIQSDVFDKAKNDFKRIISTEIFDSLKELYKTLSERLKIVKEIDETENSKTLQELKNKSMYNLKQETKKRKELIRLANFDVDEFDKFITMVDFMAVEKLYELIRASLIKIYTELKEVKQNQAIFTLTLGFSNEGVSLLPTEDTINGKFEDLFKEMLAICTGAPRLSAFFPNKNYEQILMLDANNNDKNNIDGEHVNINTCENTDGEKKRKFDEVIKDSEYYPKYTKMITDKLEKDFNDMMDLSKKDYENFKSLCEDYEKYVENKCTVILDEESNTDVIGSKLDLCNSRLKDLEGKIQSNFIIFTMIRNCEELVNKYKNYIKETQASLKERLTTLFSDLFKKSNQQISEGNNLFRESRNNHVEICRFIKKLREYDPTLKILTANIEEMKKMFNTMKAFSISSSDMDYFDGQIVDQHVKLLGKIQSANDEIEKGKEETKTTITDKITATTEKINDLYEKISKSPQYSNVAESEQMEDEILKMLEDDKAMIQKYKNDKDELNDNLLTLGFKEDDEIKTKWDLLNFTFEIRQGLWQNTHDLKCKWEEWKKKTIAELFVTNPPITTQIENFNEAIDNLDSKLERTDKDKVLNNLKAISGEINKFMSVIQIISSPAMEDQHWTKFFNAIGLSVDGPNKSVTLDKIIDEPSTETNVEEIENILAEATAQKKILTDIENIENQWKEIEFQLTDQSKVKGETKLIIATVEEIYQKLDEHSNIIQGDLASRHIKDIRGQVVAWDDKLNSLSSIIEEWLFVQKQWIYLENIFSAEDIQKQLPGPTKDFKAVNKSFKDLMKKTKDHPIVIDITKDEKLLSNLQSYHNKLENVQKCLEDYLQTKRKAFPRFYFLSNDELLKILSNTRQPRLVNDYLSKCFDGIKQVNFVSDKSNEIIEMMSPENEIVNLSETLLATQNIEGWLNDLERSMLLTVYDKTKACLEAYPPFKEPRRDWIYKGFPCQCVITIDQVKWAEFVEKTLSNISKGDSLQNFYDYMETLIRELTDMVKEKSQKLQKSLVERLILINVHAREVVKSMITKNVKNSNDFEWQKNLKFYWEEEVDVTGEKDARMEIIIKQTNSRFVYGYEYLGNPERMVITPLTDKCYITLTSALHINYGGAPAGPAGTGKTETTKDLSKAMAIKVNVFNCTDQIDYKMMGRMFCGLSECGAWACFDEFNRIEIEVLSVIAQQIETIQTHLRQKKWLMQFEGKEINLKPRFGVFITMNPGYAGRTELPDNLKSLFRPVAMMIPDYSLVAEVTLYSKGFKTAKELSVKMFQLFKLSSEQLSKQKHYDFGLRGIKSILTRAGYLREKSPNDPEAEILIRAMKDSNLPKFLKEDIVLFMDIIKDLFPTTVVRDIRNTVFEDKVKAVTREMLLQPEDGFCKKVNQLLDTMMVRLGNMIVGLAGTGKTSVYTVLMNTLKALGDNPETAKLDEWYVPIKKELLNPKAVPKSDLYMAKDETTQTWEDGIVAKIMRNAEEEEKEKGDAAQRIWVVFDGPVDATWIEDMNTVLDDSRKLCLPDSSNIRIPKLMNLIFEVQDLKVASPATVSRCGMVYIEPIHVGIKPIIQSWAEKFKEKLKKDLAEDIEKKPVVYKEYINGIDKIRDYLLQYIQDYLDSIRDKYKEKIPSVDINLVQSCLNFMSCFYDKNIIVPESKPEKHANYYLAFSLVWSLGANLSDEYRRQFSIEFKKHLENTLQDVKFSKDQSKPFTSVYDYAVCAKSPEFEPFFDEADPKNSNVIDDKPYFEILIKTGDTEKYGRLMKILSEGGYNSLFMGETGVGKSVIISNFLKGAEPEKFITKSSNFSAKTIAKNVYDILKTTIYKNGNFAPNAGKKFIFFVDDINLPQLDTFGAQQPIEFIRQLIDNKMLYDEKKMPRTIKDTFFMSACCPPSGGRNPVTPRLFRHFNMIWMTDLSTESMETIFSCMLANFLKNNPKLEKETDVIIKVALSIYNKIREKLLPTPSKSHYTFNLRDMSKVIQGMKKATKEPKDLPDKKQLVLLWVHETCRQFRDRLLSDDIPWFDNEITTLYEGPLQMEKKSLMPLDELIFTVIKDSYKMECDYEKLTKKVNDDLQRYGMKNTKMNLVFFKDAINHFCRITRILSLERGNALLIGLGGSGRQSLTKLVVSSLNQEFYTLQIKKEYGPVEFGKDLIEILKGSATKGSQGSFSSFLFSDTQILKESFMEDINNILNNGEVPNLMKEDDLAYIQNVLKDKAKENKYPETKDGIYQYFVSCVRDSLHIILSFSPVGSGLRNRCIQFPAIINCCTIDWFNVWPKEALKSVAENFLKKIGETERGKQATTVKPLPQYLITQLSKVFVEIQNKALELSGRFQTELRRYYYITPTSYLGFLNLFNDIYNEKIKIIPEQVKNYRLGIGKLKEANIIVNNLKEQLIVLEPQLKENQKQVAEMIEVLKGKREVVGAEKEKIEKEAAEIEVKKNETQALKEECDADLAKAKPALQAAQDALNSLDEKDLQQLKSYPKPVEAIVLLAKNICFIFGSKGYEYSDFKIVMGDVKAFKAKCLDTDTMITKLNDKTKLLKLGKFYDEIKNLDFSKISQAAKGLKQYVGALLEFVTTYRFVKPKMDESEKQTKALNELLSALQIKKDALQGKIDELKDLEKQYNTKLREAKQLESNINTIQVKMVRAGKLVDGLKDEGIRWADKIVELGKEEKNLLSNVIISATVVAYFGPFVKEYRDEFLEELIKVIIRNGFHYSKKEEEKKEEEENKEEEEKKEEEKKEEEKKEEEKKEEVELTEEQKKEQEEKRKEEERLKQEEEAKKKAEEEERLLKEMTDIPEAEMEERLSDENIPEFKIQAMLSDPMEIRDWTYNSLPSDDLSIENAIITNRAKRWPLIIDPQMQANKWIRNYFRSKSLCIYKTNTKQLFNCIKNCVSNGNPCLLENVEETVDNSLEPILVNNTYKAGINMFLTIPGDKPIQYIPTFKLYMTSKMANPHYFPELSIKVTLINFTVTRKGLADQLLVEVVKNEKAELETMNDQAMLSINQSKKQISDLETKILNLVKDAGDDILDTDNLVNTLEESKVKSIEIKKTLDTAEATALKISKERRSYQPIAIRGSLLYFQIASLAMIDSMYNYSLEYFLGLFNQRLKKSAKSDDINERIDILIKDITISFYEKISRGLFEKDKLLYSFMIVVAKLQNDDVIKPKEWQFFLRGAPSFHPKIDQKNVYYTKGIDKWMDIERYTKFLAFKDNVDEFIKIDQILGDFSAEDQKLLEAFMKSDNPQKEKLPDSLDKICQGFNRLLLVKQFREEKLIFAIRHFIETTFDKRFLESPPFSVSAAYDDSTKITPLIFILSPGANPVKYIREFAENSGAHIIPISLGQGQEKVSMDAIKKCSSEGGWVCLENCHLAVSFLPKLEELIQKLVDNESEMHTDYRLFLTSMPTPKFPASILQSGVKVTNEPPKGIRASLKGTYINIKEDDFKGVQAEPELRKLTFALAFFHAVILERRKYGSIGWNIPYAFMNSDLDASRLHLRMYLDEYVTKVEGVRTVGSDVPFEILNFLIGTINYGGRVTDDKDEKLIMSILNKCYCTDLIDDEKYSFSESGIYYAPDCSSLEEVGKYIESLPLDDEPEVFGLNNNANINLQNKLVNEFMTPLISIQPRSTSAGTKSPDEIVLEIKYDIDSKFKEVKFLEVKKANPKSIFENSGEKGEGQENQEAAAPTKKKKQKQEQKKTPLGNFLVQECEKFNNLLKVMKTSLRSLELAVKGTEVMSPQIELVYHSFINGQVPNLWADNAYLSLKPLGSWIDDLIKRFTFMTSWLYDGPQDSFWISAFFFPQGFNTAVLQTYARKTLEPIDKLIFRTNVQRKRPGDEGIDLHEDGLNIHGLFLEGASWDFDKVILKEQPIRELHYEMPVIWLEPVNVSKLKKFGYYECPLYKTSTRAGELSTTGISTNFVMYFYLKYDEADIQRNQDHWIRRGAALLTQLDS